MKNCKLLSLLLILALGLLLAYQPHFSYHYPLHVDEWNAIAYANEIKRTGRADVKNPYTGEGQIRPNLEAGFQIVLLLGHQITGLDMTLISLALPGLFFALSIILAFLIGRRYNFGPEAAFFIAITPTTVRLLGPKFSIASSLGVLLFISSIYLLAKSNNWKYYLALAFVIFFAVISHPLTVFALAVLTGAYVLFDFKKLKPVIFSWLAALLLASPRLSAIFSEARSYPITGGEHFLPYLAQVFKIYGLLPTIFFVIGAAILFARKEYKFVIISSVAFLLLIFLFINFGFGLSIIYDRVYIFLFASMGLIAGAGLNAIRRIDYKFAKLIYFIFICLILFFSVSAAINEPYYHIIDKQQYDDFIWIKENLPQYNRTIIDPWLAKAFIPITGKYVYAHIKQSPDAEMGRRIAETDAFFADACKNISFLQKKNISIVYGNCSSTDLAELKKGIYAIKR